MSHLTPARHLRAALLALGLLVGCSGVIGEASGDGGVSNAEGDGGGSDAGSEDAGSTPVFVAQGHAGRTTVSCDDGNTWVANRSDNDSLVCFSNGADCDHHSGAGRGIAFGQGYFVATFGWGAPGTVRRSRNGVQWETTLSFPADQAFAGVAFGADTFMLGGRPPRLSTDRGASWQAGGEVQSEQWNVRRSGFAAHGGGRLVLAFGSEGNDVNLSSDRGATWARLATLPAACAGDMQWSGGIEYGNGVMLIVGGTGVACRSTDGGQTWTETSVGGEVTAQLVWTGTEFLTWGRTGDGTSVLFRSTNGAAWTATPTVVRRRSASGAVSESPGPSVGAVARGDTGTFVAVRGGWQVWYGQQEFYRSADGLTWDALPPGAFAGSHPIQFIAFGRVAPGVSCP